MKGILVLYLLRKSSGERGLAVSSKKQGIDWFKKKGLNHLSLSVYAGNDYAHQIYEKWGFFDYYLTMKARL